MRFKITRRQKLIYIPKLKISIFERRFSKDIYIFLWLKVENLVAPLKISMVQVLLQKQHGAIILTMVFGTNRLKHKKFGYIYFFANICIRTWIAYILVQQVMQKTRKRLVMKEKKQLDLSQRRKIEQGGKSTLGDSKNWFNDWC